jgi:gephyrin
LYIFVSHFADYFAFRYHRALATFDPSRNAFLAISTGNQISSRLLSMHSANVLLEIPQGDKILRKGDQVSALLIGNLGNYQIPEQLITSNPKMGCSHHHHSASHMKKDASQNIFHVRIGLLVCSDRASSGERADKCIVCLILNSKFLLIL